MVIGIIGENCSGKSTLGTAMATAIGAELISGKDYLRMAKSESEATTLFREKLRRAMTEGNVIYVIAEPALVDLLPAGAIKVLVRADLDVIVARFAARLHGNMPPPVRQMLERKHGIFDQGEYDYVYDGNGEDPAALCEAMKARLSL